MVDLRQLVLFTLASCGSREVMTHEVTMSGLNFGVASPNAFAGAGEKGGVESRLNTRCLRERQQKQLEEQV